MDKFNLLNEITVKDNENLEEESGEVQLLAIISKKEYISYAIIIRSDEYLMLIDNTITFDLLKSNKNIVVLENNQQKEIKLLLKDMVFFKKNLTIQELLWLDMMDILLEQI